jgi:hypothetical protein
MAARIERGHPWRMVLWGTHSRLFWAFPRFTAQPGTIITASTAAELQDRMRQAELTVNNTQRRP